MIETISVEEWLRSEEVMSFLGICWLISSLIISIYRHREEVRRYEAMKKDEKKGDESTEIKFMSSRARLPYTRIDRDNILEEFIEYYNSIDEQFTISTITL